MGAWLETVWDEVWPNLVADLLWVPVAAWWAHSRARRLAARQAERIEHSLQQHRQELHLYLGNQPGPG